MTRIQLRHDTAANFASVNPVLLAGEVGVETDTNKMKIGDGTTAYNSLDYFGGEAPDLSNYYNKTETDTLLDEKQDVLTPNNPLTISTYTKFNLVGMSYTQDNLGIYTTDQSSAVNYVSTTANSLVFNKRESTDITSENMYSCGYVDIPITESEIAISVNRDYSLAPALILGKLDNNNTFIPIAWTYGAVVTQPSSLQVAMDEVVVASDGTYAPSVQRLSINKGSSVTGSEPFIIRINKGSQSVYFEFLLGRVYPAQQCYGNLNITNTDIVNRLNEITIARILPCQTYGQTASNPIKVSDIGKYDYTGSFSESMTQSQLGTNLFDIEGFTKTTSLDLSIGIGLSVDANGNLINTNPTPVDVSTKVTGDGISTIKKLTQTEYDALATKDANTFYVIVPASNS